MPTYITLTQFTQQGAQHLKELPNAMENNREAFKKAGIELKSWYLTMGQYDIVTVFDAPNDDAAAKAMMALALQGNVRTQTMRAFSFDEFKKIAGSLS
jgi:uncharacterized protein with GYD domain